MSNLRLDLSRPATLSRVMRLQQLPSSVHAALDRLRAYRLPLNFKEAAKFLRLTRERAELLYLYRHYFPIEFAASAARLTPEWDEVYSPKEKEFLELADHRLFPLPLDYYFQLSAENGDERLRGIEIMRLGVDFWDEDPDWVEYGWKLLLVLTNDLHPDVLVGGDNLPICLLDPAEAEGSSGNSSSRSRQQVSRASEAALEDLVDSIRVANPNGTNVGYNSQMLANLERLCRQEFPPSDEPFAYLPLALKMLYKDTGLIFLDLLPESDVTGCFWNVEDVEYLTDAYRQTNEWGEKVRTFLDWLEGDVLTNYRKVIELWNQILNPVPN
jgi:hypothetical protein